VDEVCAPRCPNGVEAVPSATVRVKSTLPIATVAKVPGRPLLVNLFRATAPPLGSLSPH
jgi:hypothetical protein